MGIQQGDSLTHWNYFLSIEIDLQAVSRFIEPCENNYHTFSQELARLLLASASEADVLLKAICEQVSPGCGVSSIKGYESVVRKNIPQLFNFNLQIPKWGLNLSPWSSWDVDTPPLWWTACNKVKHHRDREYHRANLKNTLNSVAALFTLNLYYHRRHAEQATLLPIQSLFRVEDVHFGGTTFNGVEFGINYVL